MANPVVCVWLFISSLAGLQLSHAQENTQRQIPSSLIECYNSSYFMNRDNRLPSNIDTLITLIEKVENSNDGADMSLRDLASSLLHRFRQDGIQRAPGINPSPGVLPYSPTGYQFAKFRILLSRLIPAANTPFPNNSLSREERCSLHFMLSSSFNKQTRGDENQVCYRLNEYASQRLQRDMSNEQQQHRQQQHQQQQHRLRRNFIDKVEAFETSDSLEHRNNRRRSRAAPQYRRGPNSFDYGEYWHDGTSHNPSDNSISSCPVENGVIWTPWGTVSAGTVIAGIAAGLQKQQVQLRALLAFARREGSHSAPQAATVAVDNRWAATLAGDLAEVALLQVPSSANQKANVGANGAWNSTVMPKWYFVKQSQNLEMTDAEIRGGLDGLILALNVEEWHRQASSMKLSQLLRMYYSKHGVLDSGIMACNRKDQFQKISPLNDLIVQTSAFAQVLDREMQLDFTLSPEAIAEFSTISANALMAYIPQYLNDVTCPFSNAQSQDISESIIAMTNIYVYLDTSWQYNDIVNYLNYILQHLNINPYASSVTLLSAFDASVIAGYTNYLTDVYTNWNVTTHSRYTSGFNLPTILNSVQNRTQNYMNEEKRMSSVGGRSLVALLIPNSATVGDTDSTYSLSRLQYINEQIPDLRFLFFGGGSINRFSAFVRDPTHDLYPLNIGNDVRSASDPVIKRIKKKKIAEETPNCSQKDSDEIFDKIIPVTHIYVVVDTAWPYRIVADYLNYVLQRLNIHPQQSSITLVCGADAEIVVNTTHYLTDFYTEWNVTRYSHCPAGFYLPRLLSKLRDLVEIRLMRELNESSSGGSSLVALLMPNPLATITDGDLEYSIRFSRTLNRAIPDLNLLYYAGGAVVRFKDLVVNPQTDLFPLMPTTSPEIASQPVVNRIRRIPRRLSNPHCGVASETTNDNGQNRLLQRLRPGGISFYRLLPNYFFDQDRSGTENRRALSIQAVNSVFFTVCVSRSIVWPSSSTSSSSPRDQRRCSQIIPNNFTLDLSHACRDYGAASNLRDCPPLYVSVQAQDFIGSDEQNACTRTECRTPDEVTYAMQLESISCHSGSEKPSDALVVTVMTSAILLMLRL